MSEWINNSQSCLWMCWLFKVANSQTTMWFTNARTLLSYRQRGHLADIRSIKSALLYVEHFRGCGIENYTITGVEKLRNMDPHVRKAREKYYKELFDVQIK